MRALIYVRISRDKAGAGLGVDRQEADCRLVAERLGWDVVGLRVDNDISAYSGKPRPGYRQLLADLEAGLADAVVVWHTDRLHRSPVELEAYVDLCDRRGVVTQTVSAGSLDLSTASGRMVARMLGSTARYEVEHSVERMQRKHLEQATAGKWAGGRRPFGYRDDGVTVDPAEAGEIKRTAAEILNGASLNAVTAGLNGRGVRTSTGREWYPGGVRRMLVRARNAGLRQHRGDVMGDAEWPAVLDNDTWLAVRARLTDPSRRTSPEYGRRWLGSGLYLCGVCGDTVVAGTSSTGTGGHKPGYRCRTRKHITRDAVAVDELVEAVVIERLSRPDAAKAFVVPTRDTSALHTEVVVLRSRLDDLAAVFADGGIDARQLAEGTQVLRTRLGDIETAIADATSGSVLSGVLAGGNVAEIWAGLDLSRRRAIVEALLTVTIAPGRKGRMADGGYFDPEAVQIKWRQ